MQDKVYLLSSRPATEPERTTKRVSGALRSLSAQLTPLIGREVEAVCATLSNEMVNVLDGIASLIDKSLLHQTEQEGEEPRLSMLETVREYGLECLRVSGEAVVTQRAHAHYYLSLAEKAEPYLIGAEQLEWLDRLEREQDNLRATLSWLMESEEMEMVEEVSMLTQQRR